MGADRSRNYELTTVSAASTITASGSKTATAVLCRGAKAVHFLVYSTSADADVFVKPNLIVKADADVTTGLTVTAPETGAGAMGLIAPNAAACVTSGTNGYILSVFPDQPGTDAGSPKDQIIIAYSIALVVIVGAADVSNVIVKALVEY